MKSTQSESQATVDLAALSVAAQGQTATKRAKVRHIQEDQLRQSRIADLKTQYQNGTLQVDDKSLASKLVDSLFKNGMPEPK